MEFFRGLVIKDLAMSLLWLRFHSWPRNFHMPQAQSKKKKKKCNFFFVCFYFGCVHGMQKFLAQGLTPAIAVTQVTAVTSDL